ncbi:MAG TPA: alpha/beta fold hydrolase [Streptosporangiaceae bacterium]|nr:alpha/beta fold hydrolase [Streptosporangiaceae bacterium]
MGAFVLVHSPVTGPSTWRWVADELTARGHRVTVPAVPPAATALGWPAFVGAVSALSAGASNPVLVGHSGAGPLLPRIGTRIGARALVFVDADIPPEDGQATLVPEEFLEFLRGLANGGVLPPWSDWFGSDAMRELIPADEARRIISAELPAVPLSYFEAHVPVPPGWTDTPCGYVLLSEAYAEQAARAAASGWPVVRLPGAHLDIVTRPAAIADAILSAAGESSVQEPVAGEPAAEVSAEPAAGERTAAVSREPAARELADGELAAPEPAVRRRLRRTRR